MPASMTAFARTIVQFDGGTLTWELRSVNHRYLENNFRLPETLRELEMPLREILRKHLQRGKLDCTLQLLLVQGGGVSVNVDLAGQYVEASQIVEKLLHNPAPISPLDILRWPGVLEERQVGNDELKQQALALFESALSQLVETRQREGEKLHALILPRLNAMAAQVQRVRGHLPALLAAQRQKLHDKLNELAAELDHDRLEQEIVYIAQKADVAEELDRLETHIEEIHRVLNSKGAIGRRLDFLMQELNREANTLSSKSLAGETTQAAVELKVLIEQVREQVQNIE